MLCALGFDFIAQQSMEVAMASRPTVEKPNVRPPSSVADSLPDRWVDLLIYLNDKEREEAGRFSDEKTTQPSAKH